MIDLTYFRNNLEELRISLARKKFELRPRLCVNLDKERRMLFQMLSKLGITKEFKLGNVKIT